MAGVLFEDIFDVKDINPEGQMFDRGKSYFLLLIVLKILSVGVHYVISRSDPRVSNSHAVSKPCFGGVFFILLETFVARRDWLLFISNFPKFRLIYRRLVVSFPQCNSVGISSEIQFASGICLKEPFGDYLD